MSTVNHGGYALSTVCADDLGAHVFRHQVADALQPYWRARSIGLRSCGEAGARLRCSCCSGVHVAPYRCGARSCPTCAHIASAVAVDKLATRAGAALAGDRLARMWEGPAWPREKRWYLFTGTQQTAGRAGDDARYAHADLLAAIRRVRGAWGPFWRSASWGARVYERSHTTGRLGTRLRRDVVFAMGLEVAPGGMVHLHAAVYGERIEPAALRPLWCEALGAFGFVQLKRMRAETADDFKKSLREVLKYVSKGERSPRRAAHAAAIERAMRGIRRVETGGAVRARELAPTTPELAAHAQSCTDCGAQGNWQWAGIRSPSYVVNNGGFGRDVTRARELALRDRAAMEARADAWRDDARERDLPHEEWAPALA